MLHDVQHDSPPTDDLSALSWVHEELRRTLEGAHKTLRRHLRESDSVLGSDVDAVDPAVLRQARAQLHQAAGVLEMVGLTAPATLLRASEAAVQKLIAHPARLDLPAVETIERASFALLDFVARRLAGKPVSPLALFPQYRAVQELAGADRVHPADLWNGDEVTSVVLPAEPELPARVADDAFRDEVERHMLALLRQPRGPAASAMSDLFAGLANATAEGPAATLWRLAAAFFEGQAQGLLPTNVYAKRVAPRLLAQLRLSQRQAGGGAPAAVSERLRRDLLFFCAQAGEAADATATPRLAAVRRAFGLEGRSAIDYESPQLGRFDPAWIAQARKRIGSAKDAWSAVCGGELHRLGTLVEPFSLVGDSLRRLYPRGDLLADALQAAAVSTVERAASPPTELAMEVATAMLFLDASLEDADFDHPEQGERVQRVALRIGSVLSGAGAPPLEGWMEELYRRVSDRQTMGSVVQELRASLAEAEKAIDAFFRDAHQREGLIPVPGQLQTMRGVLSVLGLDQAALAVQRMREDVEALIAAGNAGAEPAIVDRLTGNLGVLGFLIDMLGVQPPLAKALFRFAADEGLLRSVVGTGEAVVEPTPGAPPPALLDQAQSLALAAVHPEVGDDDVARSLERLSQEALVADQTALAQATSRARNALARAGDAAARQSAREDLALAMAEIVAAASPVPAAPLAAPIPAPASVAPGDDDEMREIFLEEAREVLANAREVTAALAATPDALAEITAVRRAFHTLKGSSRMVGLDDFGEAAWACEQLYNARLAEAPRADDDLLGFTADALTYLGGWIEAIAAHRQTGHAPAPVRRTADALRLEGRREALPLPPAEPAVKLAAAVPSPTLEQAVPDLPPVEDLEFGTMSMPAFDAATWDDLPAPLPVSTATPTAEAPATSDRVALPGIDLVFDEASTLAAVENLAPVEPAGVTDAESSDLALPEVIEAAEASAAEAVNVPAGDAAAFEPAFEFDLGALDDIGLPPAAAPAAETSAATAGFEEPAPPSSEADQFRQVGPLRIGIPLFNIYLNEADELSRRLVTELAEWAHERERPVAASTVALAHSLAGSSATVGYDELSGLARALEHALMRSRAIGPGTDDEAALFTQTADEIRRLLHHFAAGFLTSVPPVLLAQLEAHEREAEERLRALGDRAEARDTSADVMAFDDGTISGTVEAFALDVRVDEAPIPAAATGAGTSDGEAIEAAPSTAPLPPLGPAPVAEAWRTAAPAPAPQARAVGPEIDEDIDVEDAIDAELFPIFEEEAQELLPQLAARMRDWLRRPGDGAAAAACMRSLHTIKGGARLAGAMRLGEVAHRLETSIEHLLAAGEPTAPEVERLQAHVDTLDAMFTALRGGEAAAAPAAPDVSPAPPATQEPQPTAALSAPPAQSAEPMPSPATPAAPIDWARFAGPATLPAVEGAAAGVSTAAVRVRVPLLDRLVNHAGEVSITRSRIEADVQALKGSLADLTDNLERLRRQLRDLELQAETQIASRLEQAKAAAESFDPLEFDRFTRFQELTRMMAESVNDVATVQRSLQRTLQSTEDELAAQARLTRDLQDDLLRTRMVEFEGLSDRLYRVVRQAAKETGKQVRLDLVGGSIEVDRGVLDRMTPAFEHLLRNCVTHGIEPPEARTAAGKDAAGQITVTLTHDGNEVGVEFHDDGAGLNLPRIRERAQAMGLLAPQAQPSDAELAQMIFAPGFSTAERVTELAGRGIGMDVVRSEVIALGGRIETTTAAGHGTSFRLVLPLTTAVTQVVMLRCGTLTVAVPSTLVEAVRRIADTEAEAAYAGGRFMVGDEAVPFFWLGALLDASARSSEPSRSASIVVVRSAQQRVALHVDEVLGNQEVVVKNLGPQLSRLPGLAGVTLLASGLPMLIYNPVALATLYGERAQALSRQRPVAPTSDAGAAEAERAPLVLVVDDSLTVRRVTQRLLQREGYRVALAKDGLDALERLAEETPALVLSDIEMPRMDGFDLVRNLRGDARWRDLPVIMITSRIAQKHRDVAAELGVNHYLGKPYGEEDLLALVARHAHARVPADMVA